MVADRGGFRYALSALIEEAHESAPHAVALLAHGAEHAPAEVIEDLAAVCGGITRGDTRRIGEQRCSPRAPSPTAGGP